MKTSLISAFLFVLLIPGPVSAQTAYLHINYKNVYGFIDELASEKLIDYNSCIKPISEQTLVKYLNEALRADSLLNKRQKKEIAFYLDEYAVSLPKKVKTLYRNSKTSLAYFPPKLSCKDSLVYFKIKPIWGTRYLSNGNGSISQTWGGAEAQVYIGKHWAVYASLRDNYQKEEVLALPSYFTLSEGGNYKMNEGGRMGGDYSEMRGGITYSWNWGSIGLVKDHLAWGDNQHGSNIFSGRTPSFAALKLNIKPVSWLELNYFHGWLTSEVIDSSRSYYSAPGMYRAVFRNKFVAANMITVSPWKKLHLSFGNSIIYSDNNVQAAYLIPILFYKSVDHTLCHGIDNQNSQMYFNISSHQIKHLHLYTSIFVDEFMLERVTDKTRTNFISFKGGFALYNFPARNISAGFEYTATSPITYKHRLPSATFESNRFNLGHYLRDNSEEFYAWVIYKPIYNLTVKTDFTLAIHGNEYAYQEGVDIDKYPFIKDKTWQNSSLAFQCNWEAANNVFLLINYSHGNIQGFSADGKDAGYYLDMFTQKFFQGKTDTFTLGFNIGF